MTEPRHTAPETRFAAVVFNPTKVERETLAPVVAEEQSAAGWGETQWFETTADDPGQGATARALEAGASMVIVAGGDGTVRAVAEKLQGSGLPLALVPSGTGNLLARNMDLTLDDLGHSIHTAFSGQDRKIDLGMIELRRGDGTTSRHAYLVMAGLGLDAKMLANTDEVLKKKIGWLAYVGAIVKALRDKNQLRMRLRLDDGRARSVWAHTIIVGNCGSLQANVLLLPDAAVDDGLLDIIVLRPEGFVGWIQIVIKIVWENGVLRRSRLGRKMMMGEVRALNYSRGRSLTVSLRREEAVELDGDGFGDCVALTTWVVPGALTVRVP
jgi:diacylglycerol kinase family enzyme